ncbi:hypothetical protein RhiirA1_469352 [Rhizophagus irregularis]|uniref:Uncharacterized protein n=1 Tax=Rhizophagus irregularis TaxID=588596 RepID=A0A2I1F3F5_9GLOM|nr:hypothetical protein RhiirA1_469352 [Rhizophagus irregularis]PKY28898.1 hypothetical protein RhiirB3_445286 [Rhizophagus irregularis]
MKGVLYPNTISNKVKFDEDEEFGIILLSLINNLKDQVNIKLSFFILRTKQTASLSIIKGLLKNFIHVKDLQKENYKVSLIFQYEEDRNLTNAIISMSTSVSKNNIPKEKNINIEEHLSIPKSNIHLEIKSIEIIDVEDYRSHENLFNSKITWLDKAVLEFTLPNKPFAEGGMRKAYMVYTTNMIDDLYMLSSHIRMLIKIGMKQYQ